MYRQRNKLITRYRGLSTDDKPQGAEHGSSFHEMDTGTIYYFDQEHEEWYEAPGSRKFEPEEKTATGSVASFETDLVRPMRSVTVAMEPIQDLHGQDAPYPGGGGKNLLETVGTTVTKSGVTYTVNSDGSVVVNGTCTAQISDPFVIGTVNLVSGTEYVLSSGATNNSGFFVQLIGDGISNINTQNGAKTFTPASSLTATARIVVNRDVSVSNVTIKPMICLATATDPTAYAPYSNICPISGRSEVGVWRSGVNVWDEEWEVGGIDVNSGVDIIKPLRIRSKNLISAKPSTQYYCVCDMAKGFAVIYYDANHEYISGAWLSNKLITTPENARYLRFSTGDSYGGTYNHDISINYPSTDHDYHASDIASITVQLGQTVYGGTVDLVSGVMTVDRAMVTLTGASSENWAEGGFGNGKRYLLNNLTPLSSGVPNAVVFNYLKTLPSVSVQEVYGGKLYSAERLDTFWPSEMASITALREYLAQNPLEASYELAQPVTVQLTAQQLTTLLGTNNVWSDGGNVTVKYIAKKGE